MAAINSLEFASRFTGELDKMLVQKAVTGFLLDNALRAKFVGAKTVIMPDIDFVGLADYNRDTGFSQGAVTVAHTSYALSKDRGRAILIDREDMDETGIAELAGQVLSEYIRTEVVPEVDAYTLSKLAGVAKTKSHATAYDATKPLEQMLTAINSVRNAAGYDEELVAFVDSTMYAALMNDDKISKHIIVSDFKKGEIDLSVRYLDGVAVLPVNDDRMKSSYTFNAGSTTSTGGFTAAEDADSVHAIILPKKGASLVKKSETIRVFTPEENQTADAYKFDYRLYYDAFVKKSMMGHIYSLYTAAPSGD